MAKYNGYVTLAHSTYAEWKQAVNGNFFDADNLYGCQCMDLAMEFWWNVGFPQAYPHTSTGNADGVWTLREENVAYGGTTYFQLVTNVNDIKQGDIICYSTSPYGHIGFADIDYSSWTPDPNNPYEFPILSQNNGGTPDPAGGTDVNVHGYDIRLFQGAFRYVEWIPTPPPAPTKRKSRLPLIMLSTGLINP